MVNTKTIQVRRKNGLYWETVAEVTLDELLAEGEIRTEDDRRWPVVIRIKEDE